MVLTSADKKAIATEMLRGIERDEYQGSLIALVKNKSLADAKIALTAEINKF